MAGIVSNIIQNSIGGFVTGAVTTAGGYAGSAVTGVGNLIESSGRAVGQGIAGKIGGIGDGINNYAKSIQNATAPNAGGAVPVKRTATSKPNTLPSSGTKKALPPAKQLKTLPAPPAKKETVTKPLAKSKTPYVPPAGVAVNDRVKKAATGTNGRKGITPEKKSLPASKSAVDSNALKTKTLYTPPTAGKPPKPVVPSSARTSKPAIPGFGFGDTASKAGSVVGGYKPVYSAPTGGNKTTVNLSATKPAMGGYGIGEKSFSKPGTSASSVSGGGPKFF
ncbi:Clavaminate synthase-like protein [Venturia nashicola]|uniref:Clavaminate synthase-like protein n=1 Tax=Venturia nashicola TaxID=86259 RepID=A0A4Z1PC83_9PEZI|nr:Clavaminate synthase-like protein [Venturia nashicola]TLD31959.1 Clavaminate synthase-like protein [Venturia nashicola]